MHGIYSYQLQLCKLCFVYENISLLTLGNDFQTKFEFRWLTIMTARQAVIVYALETTYRNKTG